MNTDDKSVSVIVPTYNRWHVLPRALDSIFAQTHPPKQVIVVDDGSTDGTFQHVTETYPQVIGLQQSNQGVSAARNLGLSKASGTWIALLDSDDAWKPEKLESQLSALEREPDTRLCHTEEIWIRNGRRVNPMKKHAKGGGWLFERALPCAVFRHRVP